VSFLPSILTAYIFALNSTNSVIIIPFSSFIRYFFIRERHIVCVVCRIITDGESSDIASYISSHSIYSKSSHRIVHIVAFYIVNQAVCRYTFCTCRDTSVTCTRVEIRTSRLSVCWVCTYLCKLVCWTSARVCAVRWRLNFPQRRYDCGNSVSRSLPPRRTVRPILLLILHRRDFELFLQNFFTEYYRLFNNLYKFFSKSFFARILNCIKFNVFAKPGGLNKL